MEEKSSSEAAPSNQICLSGIDAKLFVAVINNVVASGWEVFEKLSEELLKLLEALGYEKDKKEAKGDEQTKKRRKIHEHSITFLVGYDKVPVRAHRAALASCNLVLQRILYGLDRANPNLAETIDWPDFDPMAAEKVLAALIHRNVETKVPYPLRSQVFQILDYLGETQGIVKILFTDVPWEKEGEVVGLGYDKVKCDHFLRLE